MPQPRAARPREPGEKSVAEAQGLVLQNGSLASWVRKGQRRPESVCGIGQLCRSSLETAASVGGPNPSQCCPWDPVHFLDSGALCACNAWTFCLLWPSSPALFISYLSHKILTLLLNILLYFDIFFKRLCCCFTYLRKRRFLSNGCWGEGRHQWALAESALTASSSFFFSHSPSCFFVCVCVCVCIHLSVEARGPHWMFLLYCSLPFNFLRKSSSLNLKLID